MKLKWAAIGIAVLGLGIASYGIYQQLANPMRVLSVGNIVVDDPRGGTEKKRLVTRTIANGPIVRSEVELPNGTWLDCGGDCAATVRKATIDFWDEQRKNRR